ncbi:MAG: hypothetical protein E7637_08945 [Ruminococcaceae bacterium]|nr:hypothetical protein [Oscillospiraceae bacterium]
MKQLQTGYAQVNINPPLGSAIYGYYVPRFAKGFLDDLEIRAFALSLGEKRILMFSVDVCGVDSGLVNRFCKTLEAETLVQRDQIFLSATHTHTGAYLVPNNMFEMEEEPIHRYADFVESRLVDAAKMALADLKDTRMGFGVGQAPERIAYIRRYRMKDGSTMTCPPINDPNIDAPIGTLDQRVNVLRFDREGGESVVLVNYGLHADTVNGELLSSDWPGWMYRTLDRALDGVKCIFFNGAEGDVGSTNVHPLPGDMNDTEISFDNEMKSPGMARFVGRALAGTVLQIYDKVAYVDVDAIGVLRRTVAIPANLPRPDQMPLARKYKELHDAGKDEEIPFEAMELTTVVAEALRMCKMENGPREFLLDLTGVRIGPVAFVGIPGEPFTDIGVRIKDTDGWSMILPCSLTNGDEGYFPVQSAYDEGGYEARTSPYRAGVDEVMIQGGKALLNDLQGVFSV